MVRSNTYAPQDTTYLSTVVEELQRCHRPQTVTNQKAIRQENIQNIVPFIFRIWTEKIPRDCGKSPPSKPTVRQLDDLPSVKPPAQSQNNPTFVFRYGNV